MKVGKAAGEFTVIVLGVLTALLAESFVTTARESSEADSYRIRLATDLAADVQNLEEMAAYYVRVLDSGARVRDWIETGRSDLPPADLFVHVHNAVTKHPIVINRDTWDDMVSTGNVAFLEEGERIGLSSFYRVSETYINELGAIPDAYRLTVQGYVAPEASDLVGHQCLLFQDLSPMLPPCNIDIGWDPTQALAELRREPEVLRDLNRAMHGASLQVSLATVIGDLAKTAAEQLRR